MNSHIDRKGPTIQPIGSRPRTLSASEPTTTTFGRSESFFDYTAMGSVRWSRELAEELRKGNHIWISDCGRISRTHGKIVHFPESGTLLYQDLHSTNGTELMRPVARPTSRP